MLGIDDLTDSDIIQMYLDDFDEIKKHVTYI